MHQDMVHFSLGPTPVQSQTSATRSSLTSSHLVACKSSMTCSRHAQKTPACSGQRSRTTASVNLIGGLKNLLVPGRHMRGRCGSPATPRRVGEARVRASWQQQTAQVSKGSLQFTWGAWEQLVA